MGMQKKEWGVQPREEMGGEQKGFLKETKRVFCHERKGMHPKEGYDIYRDLYGR